jgi:hypothetical protein
MKTIPRARALDPACHMVYLAASNDAQVAQLVEHATENRSVGGSIPLLGTIFHSEIKALSRGSSERFDGYSLAQS